MASAWAQSWTQLKSSLVGGGRWEGVAHPSLLLRPSSSSATSAVSVSSFRNREQDAGGAVLGPWSCLSPPLPPDLVLWEFANSRGCWRYLRPHKRPGAQGSALTDGCCRSGWRKEPPWEHFSWGLVVDPIGPSTGKGGARVVGCGRYPPQTH